MRALNSLDDNVVLACRQRLEILSLSSPKGCGQLTDPGEPEWCGATAWWINRVEEKERAADLAIDVEHVHIVEGGIDLGTEAVRGACAVQEVESGVSGRLAEVLVKHAAQTILAQYRSGLRGRGRCP